MISKNLSILDSKDSTPIHVLIFRSLDPSHKSHPSLLGLCTFPGNWLTILIYNKYIICYMILFVIILYIMFIIMLYTRFFNFTLKSKIALRIIASFSFYFCLSNYIFRDQQHKSKSILLSDYNSRSTCWGLRRLRIEDWLKYKSGDLSLEWFLNLFSLFSNPQCRYGWKRTQFFIYLHIFKGSAQ